MCAETIPQDYIKDKIALVNALQLEKNADVAYGNTKFSYITLDAMLSAIKSNDRFNERIAVTFDCDCEVSEDKIVVSVAAVLNHISGYCERGSRMKWIISTTEKTGNKDEKEAKQHKQGAAITYCKRYALAAMLGVSVDLDTDGIVQNVNIKGQKAPAQQAKKNTAAQQAKKADAPAPANPPAPAPASAPAPVEPVGTPNNSPALWTAEQKQELSSLKQIFLQMGFGAADYTARIKQTFGRLPYEKNQMTFEDANTLILATQSWIDEEKMAEAALDEMTLS